MNQGTEAVVESNVAELARRAKAASRQLATVAGERRNAALKAAAYAIEECKSDILDANQRDCDEALRAVEDGRMSQALFERLQLTERGIGQMAAGVRKVAALADPLGRKLAITQLD